MVTGFIAIHGKEGRKPYPLWIPMVTVFMAILTGVWGV